MGSGAGLAWALLCSRLVMVWLLLRLLLCLRLLLLWLLLL